MYFNLCDNKDICFVFTFGQHNLKALNIKYGLGTLWIVNSLAQTYVL